MSFQKYEYFLDENSYHDLTPYENLECDFSEYTEKENLDSEYYQEEAEDPYINANCTFPERYFNRKQNAPPQFNDSKLPCYILPVMCQQRENPQLFRSDHKRVYPSLRQVRFHNSLPINTDKVYETESKDHCTETETVEEVFEDDRRSIYTDYATNTDAIISDDNMTLPSENPLASDESEQELESIYTSQFICDSTLTDTISQSTVEPFATNILRNDSSNERSIRLMRKTNAEKRVPSVCEEEEETTLDSLDKFLIKAAQEDAFKPKDHSVVLPFTPIILIYLQGFISWLKFIPVCTYKYCLSLRHVLFI